MRRSFYLRSEIMRSTEQQAKRPADHVAVHESGTRKATSLWMTGASSAHRLWCGG